METRTKRLNFLPTQETVLILNNENQGLENGVQL